MSVPAAAGSWRPLSPCATATCVRPATVAAGRVRRTARLAGALVVVLAGVPVALACRVAGLARRSQVTGAWARLLLRALGVHLKIVGTAPTGTPAGTTGASAGPIRTPAASTGAPGAPMGAPAGTLVVGNHVSWLDPIVVAATVSSRPLAKHEIAGWPVVGTLVAGAGALFIDRERLSALPSAVAAVTDALRAGHTVVAFPEGTTWCGLGMGGFRPAVFQAAIDAGATVLPATLRWCEGERTSTRASFVGDDSLLASLVRVAGTRHLVVEVTLRAPVRPGPGTRRAALAGLAEARVRAGLTVSHHPEKVFDAPATMVGA